MQIAHDNDQKSQDFLKKCVVSTWTKSQQPQS